MGHRYQKGSQRPGKTDNPRRHERRPTGYVLSGGIPWPEFADGTPYADRFTRVRHTELPPEHEGRLQSVEWCHPDGSHMPDGKRSKPATKTRGETTNPGAWYAIVSWDERDRHPEVRARVALAHLVPIHPPA